MLLHTLFEAWIGIFVFIHSMSYTVYEFVCVCVCTHSMCNIRYKEPKIPFEKDEFMLDRAIDILFVLITHIVVALKRAHIDLLETLSLSFIFFAAISHLAIPKFFV